MPLNIGRDYYTQYVPNLYLFSSSKYTNILALFTRFLLFMTTYSWTATGYKVWQDNELQ